MKTSIQSPMGHQPWNKGRLVGQKAPLRLRDIWAIRVRLQLRHAARDLALFDLAIDSKLRACDLVKLRVLDVAHGHRVSQRATVLQQKTQRPVQFEITEPTRAAISAWIAQASLHQDAFLFPSRLHGSLHLSTRQYARIAPEGPQRQWRTPAALQSDQRWHDAPSEAHALLQGRHLDATTVFPQRLSDERASPRYRPE
ncbi:MAG: hypothetical protein ABI142_07860 [Bryocella sp.]